MARRFRTVIHWFRRDLRLTDNTALHHAVEAAEQVVPVYIVSDWSGFHHWTGAPRQEFLCGCLRSLAGNVESAGGRMIFRRGPADRVLRELIAETGAEAIFFNRDPDPFGIRMEERIDAMGKELGVEVHSHKDVSLQERAEVLTGSGTPYRVFTPYSRSWLALPKAPVLPRVSRIVTPQGLRSDLCPTLETWGLQPSGVQLPEAGERAARDRMKQAFAKVVPTYAATRNTPHGVTTSRLSSDLRFGTLSIRELFHRAQALQAEAPGLEAKKHLQTWINELAWREFYFQVLWHWPEVLEQEFDPKTRGLPWSYDEQKFQRWKNGQTGFPIVDAGMRELAATGFMHNRVRMITAMFLTKDLRIDWRMGEQHFMQTLTDGEIGSNNGGWQWSAGTGADAAPWFRIQNPWTQTKSYDPDGHYIRRWVPELKDVPSAALWTAPKGKERPLFAPKYPAPMVDHSEERERTLAMFKKQLGAER